MQTPFFLILLGIGGLIVVIVAALKYDKEKGPLDERINKIHSKEGSDMGILPARYHTKRVEANTAHTNALTIQTQATYKLDAEPDRLRRAEHLEIASHETLLATQENTRLFVEAATKAQETPLIREAKIAKQFETDEEIRKHQQMGEIDIENRWKEIVQDSDAADLKLIGDHLATKKLRQELSQARERKYRIEHGRKPKELKAALLADCDEEIQRLKARIDEREARYILLENGPAPREITETASDSRTEYPPEVDAGRLRKVCVSGDNQPFDF